MMCLHVSTEVITLSLQLYPCCCCCCRCCSSQRIKRQ